MVSFAKAPYWESMDTISILLGKIWNWFCDYKSKTFRNQRNVLFMKHLLSVIPECHIVSKDYCIKETGGKEV